MEQQNWAKMPASPYSFTWGSVGNGTYTLSAVATDDRGAQATAQVSVAVSTTPGVTVYKHCDYGGYAISLPVGTYTLNQLYCTGSYR